MTHAHQMTNQIIVILDDNHLSERAALKTSSSTLILNLENLNLVRLSNDHPGPIRWICSGDPRMLVGPMLDHYRGTYYRPNEHQLVYSSDDDLEIYDLPQGMTLDQRLLAAVCAARESGVSPEAIRVALQESTPLKPETFLQ